MANTKKYVSLDKLGLYDGKIKKVISDGDAAALAAANKYADGLAVNYDVAGAAATALEDAKTYADGKDEAIAAAKKAGDDAAAAAGVADGKAVAAQGAADAAQADVDALEAYVGTFTHDTAKTVVEYINAKTDGIATSGNLEALAGRVTAVEGDVATIKGDYLKAADKEELQGDIDEKAAQTDLDAVSAVANAAATKTALEEEVETRGEEITRVEGLVTAEAERAAGVEAGLEERLVEVETFFKTTEGQTLDEALDTLVEIQKYITDEGSAADQMVLDIAANKKAIEDHVATDHNFAAADEALEAKLNEEIAKKAAQADLEAAVGRVTTAEGKIAANEGAITALQGADTTMSGRIDALEAKFGDGEGSVEDMVADAKQEAIDSAVGTAAADATSKANAAESNAKSYADGLNTEMDARVDALEAIDHDHANKTELDLIATGDKAKWDAAAAIAHEHGNKAVLDGITAENVTTWNTVTSKAAQADLTAVGDRVTAIETWHSNFVEVSEEEINGLFA